MSNRNGTHPHTVTLQQIADLAGVHVSTVSRILRAPNSSSASAETVRGIARELGYRPDWNAASLRTQQSKTIGVLVPRLTDHVLAAVYDAVELTANGLGFETFVANTHDDVTEQRRRVDLLLSRRVDGLVLGDCHLDGSNLAYLDSQGIPYLLVNRRSGTALSVTADDLHGGRLVGRHLVAAGHRRIGIVTGPSHASTAVDRSDGCREAARELGVLIGDDDVVSTGFNVADGREGAELLLQQPNPPTAIFAANDFTAIGVLGVLRDRGLQPGLDIAVVGYNDIPLAAELTVPLTTVSSPMEEMGRQAVESLMQILGGGDPLSQTLAPALVIRQTSPSKWVERHA